MYKFLKQNAIYVVPLFLIILICVMVKIMWVDYMFEHSYTAYQKYGLTKLEKLFKIDTNYHVTNNYNVIFFYSHDYDVLPKYVYKTHRILENYCYRHGYKLLMINHNNDKNKISPYWLRVQDLIDLSIKYPEPNNVFIYLDLDTCLNPKYLNTPVTDLMDRIDHMHNTNWDIYVGTDTHQSINAGAIIVKNTEWSKKFLLLWAYKYKNAYWVHNTQNKKWSCFTPIGNYCEWARDGYEQGEINNIYHNNELSAKYHIAILNSSIMSNNSILLDSFIYHFYGDYAIPFYDIKIDGIDNLYKKFNKVIRSTL